jgi:hypothetical protein
MLQTIDGGEMLARLDGAGAGSGVRAFSFHHHPSDGCSGSEWAHELPLWVLVRYRVELKLTSRRCRHVRETIRLCQAGRTRHCRK